MTPVGQITPESNFGRMLTSLARESNIIVETGTLYGLGSTACLYAGMTRPEQRLYSIDCNLQPFTYAKDHYRHDPRVIFIFGTICKPEEFTSFDPTLPSAAYFAGERDANNAAPYVFDQMPPQIDLLLIDGGGWTADTEFDKLMPRTRIIAMDDSDKTKGIKNWHNREKCIAMKWTLLADVMDERNGWSVFKRPVGC